MLAAEVASELLTHYGIDATVSPLAGERDLNFLAQGANDRYIVKVQRAADQVFLSAQNRVLAHLAGVSGLSTPAVTSTRDGHAGVTLPDGRSFRVLTWMAGSLMTPEDRRRPDLVTELGRTVARLDAALADMPVDEITEAVQRPFGWDVMQTRDLLEHIDLISDTTVRANVAAILRNAVDELLPVLESLPKQLIHNDANENNIVVSQGTVSLIDFGDMILAPRVCGLAVACAYQFDESPDPVRALLPLVTGYHQAWPLTAPELALVFPLARLRVATSIVMAALQYRAHPENDYLLVSQAKFTALLSVVVAASDDLAHFRVRGACGYEPNPTSRSVRQWLMSGGPSIGDVVMPPLASARKVWFDWSASGHGAPQTSAEIAAAMAAAGADVAIGNYCEDRDVYKGDSYEVTPEARRTVHLGVDLFAPAGTPVYAALDGTVALFNDNNTYLDYGPVIVLEHHTGEGVPFWTLYGHLSRTSLEGLYEGKPITAGQQIATMGQEHENVGWAPHTHFQLLTHLVGMGIDVYGVAPLDDLPVWRSISPNPNLVLRLPEGTDAHAALPATRLRQERSVVMSRALSLNFQEPLTIVRGAGAYLYDEHGRGYLDLVNNVAHVGHCHPRVVHAGAQAMATLNTNTRYLNQVAIEYARALAASLPDPLNVVFFVNSGSEANDLALRLAQAHTGGRGVLTLEHAYHGHLSSIIDISPYKFMGRGGRGRPEHVRVVPIPDAYKGRHQGPGAGAAYAQDLDDALADLHMPLMAFICEAIVSTAGQVTLADGFLSQAYRTVRAAGGVCIADEVQIGLGRVGESFWGFELHGVVPDIVTMGKPLGNGHPIAAVVTTPEVAQSFLTGMEYFNTFGGNPVSAAIGQSVLDVIGDQGLQAHARTIGQVLMSGVRAMQDSIEQIGDVRGSGLFIGVELVEDRASRSPATQLTDDLIQYAKGRGVLLSCDGPGNNVLKIKPPLVIGETDVTLFLEVLQDGLRSALG